MIAFLEGVLASKSMEAAVMNVNGVGYRVEISGQTFARLPEEGERVMLHTHHHITDNDQRLFGFFTLQEQTLFEKLITVKGIGPRLGLGIMSGMEMKALAEAIVLEDEGALSGIPGIGKKTAGRIILELKDKIYSSTETHTVSGSGVATTSKMEAVSALEALGFRRRDAEQAVRAALKENSAGTVPDVVKMALSLLNK